MKRIAMKPDDLPATIFKAMGRATLLDVGAVSILSHLVAMVVDANLLIWLMTRAGGSADLREMQQECRQQLQQQQQQQQEQQPATAAALAAATPAAAAAVAATETGGVRQRRQG
jgi:hypothetical protein